MPDRTSRRSPIVRNHSQGPARAAGPRLSGHAPRWTRAGALLGTAALAGHAAAGSCPPVQIAELFSPAPSEDNGFGAAVAIHGDTLFVGAPWDDTAGLDTGAVYMFRLEAGAWTPAGILLPADADPGQQFGARLDLDPGVLSTLVIGSRADSDVALNRGSAYVFTDNGTGTWTEHEKLTGSNTAPGAWFGNAVAVHGDRMVIGAPLEDNAIGLVVGNAYVFERDGTGYWHQKAKLFPTSAPNGGIFGNSVDVEGELIIVGSPYLGLDFIPGFAEVFRRVQGQWGLEQHLPGWIQRDRYGMAVALEGNLAIVGGPRDSPPPYGIVQTLSRTGNPGAPWEVIETFISDQPTVVDRFGCAVVVDGGRVVVGASNYAEHGAAFVYDLDAGVPVFLHEIVPLDPAAYDLFGESLALDGDTLVVGASWDDGAGPNAGSVYVFDLVPGPAADLDGDGAVTFADLLILLGAWGPNPGHPADLDGNGIVGFADLLLLLAGWGGCP